GEVREEEAALGRSERREVDHAMIRPLEVVNQPTYPPLIERSSTPSRVSFFAVLVSFRSVPVQRPHHPDPGEHGRPVMLGDQQQGSMAARHSAAW
ncbi:MAG: hypothetical protein WAV72_06520, partial [Bradyrhizobium sp.]